MAEQKKLTAEQTKEAKKARRAELVGFIVTGEAVVVPEVSKINIFSIFIYNL